MSRLDKNLQNKLKKNKSLKEPTSNRTIGTVKKFSVKEIVDIEDARPDKLRYNPDYVHVSSILRDCPRYLSLFHSLKVNDLLISSPSEPVSGSTRVVHLIGRAIESHIRKQLSLGLDYNNIYGEWKCNCGQTSFIGLNDLKTCKVCHSKTTHYHEVTLKDEEAGIIGNPDLILFYNDKYQPVEIKSKKLDAWIQMTKPEAQHVQQVLFYRLLLLKNGFNVAKHVRLIYCAKDFSFQHKSPYKEYRISAEDDSNQVIVERLYEVAKSIKEHKINGTLPRREVCSHETCSRAKNCPFAVQCFSLQ
jgi:hypothetical protein